MPEILPPLQLFLATFAGWVNRQQTKVIDYLVQENRILKEQLKSRRLRLRASPEQEEFGFAE